MATVHDAIDIILKNNTESRLDKAELLLHALSGVLTDYDAEQYEDKLRELQLKDLAALQKRYQDLDESAKAVKATFYKFFDFIRTNVLPERMEEEGFEGGFKIEGVGRVNLLSDVYCSVPAPMKPKAYEWLEDNGHGDLIQPTINSSSLKALAKRKMRDSDPLPEEYFKVTPYTKTSITKG